jgi:hypothetical protein
MERDGITRIYMNAGILGGEAVNHLVERYPTDSGQNGALVGEEAKDVIDRTDINAQNVEEYAPGEGNTMVGRKVRDGFTVQVRDGDEFYVDLTGTPVNDRYHALAENIESYTGLIGMTVLL